MLYPVTEAIVDYILAGLKASESRAIAIEDRVRAAITKLPEGEQSGMSVGTLLGGNIGSARLSKELRAMMASPGFKVEPVISELRRAEAGYIASHDAYLADQHNGLRIDEMRWAHARLQIARQCYDAMIASRPKEARSIADRPKVRSEKAVATFRLANFSEEEQKALRQAAVDKKHAIAMLDDIIRLGRQSGRQIRLIHAWLVDSDNTGQFDRWLTDELALARSSASDAQYDDASSDLANAGENSRYIPHEDVSHGTSALAPEDELSQDALVDDDQVKQDIETVRSFCAQMRWAIKRTANGVYDVQRLDRRKDVTTAFDRVRHLPEMQSILQKLASRTTDEVHPDKIAR